MVPERVVQLLLNLPSGPGIERLSDWRALSLVIDLVSKADRRAPAAVRQLIDRAFILSAFAHFVSDPPAIWLAVDCDYTYRA